MVCQPWGSKFGQKLKGSLYPGVVAVGGWFSFGKWGKRGRGADRVGTDKGTGKSMRTRLSKKTPLANSPLV